MTALVYYCAFFFFFFFFFVSRKFYMNQRSLIIFMVEKIIFNDQIEVRQHVIHGLPLTRAQ